MRRTTSTRRSAKGEETTVDKSVINPTSKSPKKATSTKRSDARIYKNDVVVDRKRTDDNPTKVKVPKSAKCARKTRSLKSLQEQSIPKTEPPECDITPPRWNGKNNVTNKIGDASTVHVNLQEESPSYTQKGKRIKEIFQDEFLCSQSNTDEVCDVRWECSSPDVYKHLSKKSNKTRETVADIAHRLRVSEDDINPVEPELQAKSLLGLWLPESNGGSSKRLKRGGIKKKRKAAPIIPEKYQKLLEEWNARKNSENMVVPGTESAKNESKKNSIDDQYDHLFSDEDQLLPTGVVRCTGTTPAKEADDTWSDDDLFNDDSFILAASQMPLERLAELCTGSKRKRESIGLSGKSSKDSKISSSVVTSSDSNNNNRCFSSGKSQIVSVVKTGTNSNNDVQTYNENYVKVQQTSSIPPGFKTSGNNRHSNSQNTYSAEIESSEQSAVLSRNSFYGSSKCTFRKHSSFSGSPSCEFNSSQINGNSLDKFTTSNKSPFRKHHSFDACSSRLTSTPTRKSTFVRSIKDDNGKIIKPVRSFTMLPSTAINPKVVKPIRQLNSETNNPINSSRSIITNDSVHVMPKINEEIKINQTGLLQTKRLVKIKETVTPLKNFRAENRDDLLDTSISDEILRQLAEPDEILESQSTHQETLETIKSTDIKKCQTNEIIDKTLSFMFEEDDFSFSEIDAQNLDVLISDNKELQVSKSNQILKPTFQTRGQNSSSVAEPPQPPFSRSGNAMKKTVALTNVPKIIKLNGNVPISKICNNTEVINTTPSNKKYAFKKRSPKQTVNGTGTQATNSKNLLESNKNKDLSNSSRFTNMKPANYSYQPVRLNSNGSSEPLDSAVSQSQDLFIDENDSFLCEDSFLESQFLAELEKIESTL